MEGDDPPAYEPDSFFYSLAGGDSVGDIYIYI
jgi:hypothetical protein